VNLHDLPLNVRKIGNPLGLIVPKELSDLMHMKEGDTLHAVVDASVGVRAHHAV
jgi:antitoxin component of MazEF toxin-antitoxin module